MINKFNQWDKTNILIITSVLMVRVFQLNCRQLFNKLSLLCLNIYLLSCMLDKTNEFD